MVAFFDMFFYKYKELRVEARNNSNTKYFDLNYWGCKMEYSPKEITLIAVMVALIVVFGFIFYFMSYLLPLPGAKFIFLAVFLSFMFYFPIYKLQRKGIIIALTAVFALIMSFISLFMGLAIFAAGILTELLALLLTGLKAKLKAVIVAASFPCFATITFFITTLFLIEGEIEIIANSTWQLVILLLIVFILGLIGALFGYYVNTKYQQ